MRRPVESAQYTSWALGQRLREAGLLASLGSVGDALDNGLVESFFAALQTELLDHRTPTTRAHLATAIYDYVECFSNPYRRHSALDYLSPNDYEHCHTVVTAQEAVAYTRSFLTARSGGHLRPHPHDP